MSKESIEAVDAVCWTAKNSIMNKMRINAYRMRREMLILVDIS